MAFHICPSTHDLRPFMLIREVGTPRHPRVCSPRNAVYLRPSAQNWPTGLLWTVCNAGDCVSYPRQHGVPVQDDGYHERLGDGLLRCFPWWCLWALPSSVGIFGRGVWQIRGKFLRKKEKKPTLVVLLHWQMRLRKEMAGGEGWGKE